MSTLKLTILKSKPLKDGRYKIRVAVSHKSDTCYIATRFSVESISHFKNGSIVKEADSSINNKKLRAILDVYQDRLDEIHNKEIYTCRQLTEMISSSDTLTEAITYKSVCDDFIKELKSQGRDNYATLLERSCRYLNEFVGDVRLSDITPMLIENFKIHLVGRKKVKIVDGKKVTQRAMGDVNIGMMMSQIKAVINRAIKRKLVYYKVHPFVDMVIPKSPVKQTDISIEDLRKMSSYVPANRKEIVAKDLFFLSFYLGGINLVDLLQIDFNKCDKKIDYIRTKTRNRTKDTIHTIISIHPKAKDIIDRHKGRDGKLNFGYKFSYSNFSSYVSRNIKAIGEKLDIENITFYSARKSFAQYASELGVSDNVIDYCLGHSDTSRGVIRYYTKVKENQAYNAICLVSDYVDGKNPV